MFNNNLFAKAVADSKKSIQQIHEESGVSVDRINELMTNPDAEVKASEIEPLSNATNMSENMRRNVWFLRNLPLD